MEKNILLNNGVKQKDIHWLRGLRLKKTYWIKIIELTIPILSRANFTMMFLRGSGLIVVCLRLYIELLHLYGRN